MKNKKKLILIVDDDSENRKVLGNILMNNNYDVGIASDGYKALEFLKSELPDLILLDIVMPGLNGFEVCEKLKSSKATKHIPVVFLTARTNTEDIVKGFEVGGVDYVSKPFNSVELLARVNTHIEMRLLRGFLPICSSCKRIRDDDGYWQLIEGYIEEHFEAIFSHSLCPRCMEKLYGDQKFFSEQFDIPDQ